MRGGIHLFHVDFGLAKIHGVHAAADIHADDVGDRPVLHGHGGADGTALARMDVRHDADLAACRKLVITHPADLLDGLVLDDLGKADRGIYLSLNFHHVVFS